MAEYISDSFTVDEYKAITHMAIEECIRMEQDIKIKDMTLSYYRENFVKVDEDGTVLTESGERVSIKGSVVA